MKKIFPLLGACLLFFSCAAEETENLRVRASLKATGTGSIRVSVFVEGPGGNSLSGALVTVKDSRSNVLQLNYDSSACSYNGLTEELPGLTNYTVEVATIISKESIMLTVPYSRIEEAPEVIVFQDAAGNSALHGQAIKSDQPVQIGWAGSAEAASYEVTIRTALKTVYAVSTNANTITVPAYTIPEGSYLLEVSAQKIHGDIFFKSSPFCSVSFINSTLVSCDVE